MPPDPCARLVRVIRDDPASTLLGRVLVDGVRGAEAGDGDSEAPLFPEEAAAVARAVAKRRREFAAGRACARRALVALGVPAVALPPDPQRVPRWPPGVIGSITHTRDYAAAVVAWQQPGAAVGLDAERALSPRSTDVLPRIARPRELTLLDALAPEARALRGALLFSAKEAAYKCQFPATRELLDFSDAEIDAGSHDALVAGAAGLIRVRFRRDCRAGRLGPLDVRYAIAGDLVLTLAHRDIRPDGRDPLQL